MAHIHLIILLIFIRQCHSTETLILVFHVEMHTFSFLMHCTEPAVAAGTRNHVIGEPHCHYYHHYLWDFFPLLLHIVGVSVCVAQFSLSSGRIFSLSLFSLSLHIFRFASAMSKYYNNSTEFVQTKLLHMHMTHSSPLITRFIRRCIVCWACIALPHAHTPPCSSTSYALRNIDIWPSKRMDNHQYFSCVHGNQQSGRRRNHTMSHIHICEAVRFDESRFSEKELKEMRILLSACASSKLDESAYARYFLSLPSLDSLLRLFCFFITYLPLSLSLSLFFFSLCARI